VASVKRSNEENRSILEKTKIIKIIESEENPKEINKKLAEEI
jgi:hypothetical protein